MTNDLYPTHVADLLSKRAELTPVVLGLRDTETGVAYTYRQQNARANRGANYLRAFGGVKCDGVRILAPTCVAFADLLWEAVPADAGAGTFGQWRGADREVVGDLRQDRGGLV